MNRDTIPSNATIEDVLPTLSDPKEYVRAIVETMGACYQKYGNAIVRIGVTGEGKMPYHKVNFVTNAGEEKLFGAYAGTTAFQDVKVHKNTWSTESMSYAQVTALLGKLRGFNRKK